MVNLNALPLGISFDDILLLPGYVDFPRSEVDLTTKITKKISIKLPFVSAPMDTVTESKLAISLGKLGGLGVIHRNLTVSNQISEVKKVLDEKLLVAAAIGASGYEERVAALVKIGVPILVVDSAHGFSRQVIDATKYIKKKYPNIEVMSGNVSTKEGAEALIKAGADSLRIGMGPGAICTTRIISGMGVPQANSVADAYSVAKKYGVPVVADGGIKYSGDMVKAFALGASAVMMGSLFASCEESPGVVHKLHANEVPARFKSISTCGGKCDTMEIHAKKHIYKFKEYRGMGSIAAMEKGAKIKSEDEFHGKSYKDRVLVAEGVEGLVPVKWGVSEFIDQAVGGIKSGMYYVGARNLQELVEKAKFIQITQASLTESHPHEVLITNAGQNY